LLDTRSAKLFEAIVEFLSKFELDIQKLHRLQYLVWVEI
jgi:hypothetical protein